MITSHKVKWLQGFSVELTAGAVSAGYPTASPSLLGMPYLAAHTQSSAVLGSTKVSGLTPQAAFDDLARSASAQAGTEAAAELAGAMAGVWGPLSDWQVQQVWPLA